MRTSLRVIATKAGQKVVLTYKAQASSFEVPGNGRAAIRSIATSPVR
jgi:hypothetical protein